MIADDPIIGWHNLVTAGVVSATSEDADHPASNLASPSTAETWLAASAAAQTVTVTISDPNPIDYVALARHNLGSEGIGVTLEGEAASVWSELGTANPSDDRPMLFRFTPAVLTGVRLVLGAATTNPATIAVVYAGKLLEMPHGVEPGYTPLPYSRKSRITNGQSETGQFLGRIVTGAELGSAAAWRGLDPDWYRTDMAPFVEASDQRPFFFSWRPESRPLEVGYAWLSQTPSPTIEKNDELLAIQLDMGAIA